MAEIADVDKIAHVPAKLILVVFMDAFCRRVREDDLKKVSPLRPTCRPGLNGVSDLNPRAKPNSDPPGNIAS
jgi:hypothetical protein